MSDQRRYPIGRDAMPIVDLQLRAMGEIVQQATAVHAQEISDVAQGAVKDAIARFDWRGQIKDEVHKSIRQQVQRGVDAFLWSNEGKSLVEEMVRRSLAAAFDVEAAE